MQLRTWQITKVFIGSGLAVAVTVYLVATAYTKNTLLLTTIAGGTLGWILGILLSPKSKDEAKTFSEYRAGVAAFAGGVGLAKAEQYLAPFFSPSAEQPGITAEYGLYFGIALMLGLLATWVGRNADAIFQNGHNPKGATAGTSP